MPYEFKAVRMVEFSDTDMAGIMHFANFFRFMESAEHAFYRALGFSVSLHQFDPSLGLPRVHAECDYIAPLRFEDQVEVHLLVREKRAKVISYLIKFRKLNAAPPVEAARGVLTVVCVRRRPDGTLASERLPPELVQKIEVAPAEMLV